MSIVALTPAAPPLRLLPRPQPMTTTIPPACVPALIANVGMMGYAVASFLAFQAEDGETRLSYNEIADDTGISRRYVMKLVASLERAGWIAKTRVRQDDNRGPNIFTFPRFTTGEQTSELTGEPEFTSAGELTSELTSELAPAPALSPSPSPSPLEPPIPAHTPTPTPAPGPVPASAPTRTKAKAKAEPDLTGFDDWYGRYPRHVGKDAAVRAWGRLDAEQKAAAAAGLEDQLAAGVFNPDPHYIPHPATWLNQGRWADEIAHVATNPKPTPRPAAAPQAPKRGYSKDELLALAERMEQMR